MTTSAITPNTPDALIRRTQTLAWVVLLASFALFCILCFAMVIGVYWFLFESQIDLSTRLTVSNSRVDVTLPDSSTPNLQDPLPTNITLQTDSNSQGYLAFEDAISHQQLAALFVLQESSAKLDENFGPRFEWSRSAYVITLNRASGHFFVNIMRDQGRTQRPLRVSINAAVGSAKFTEPGEYRVDITDRQISVLAQSGNATLITATGLITPIASGWYGVSIKDQPQASITPSPFITLNNNFGTYDTSNNAILPPGKVPLGWICTSQGNKQQEPQGDYIRSLIDNQVVLRMVREGQNLDHGETSCRFAFESASGVPFSLTTFKSLIIRSRIKIQAQDLSTCGVAGSECPIMLELTYFSKGNLRVWRHGFYAYRSSDNYPLSCDTCGQNHERLNPNTWYLYDSGDLLKLLPEKPDTLNELKVYASGHAYEVTLAEVNVIAGTTDQP